MTQRNIKDKILSEIAEIEKQICSQEKNIKPIAPDNAIGRISRMEAIVGQSVTEASLTQAQNRLIRLKDALSRLDSPDFGICIECGRPIPVGRILIIPESRHCVNCAR